MEPFAENSTLLTQLEKHAGADPDKAAYIFVDKDLGERVITRQEIWDLTRKCAAIFKRLGLGKGDVICNTLANCPEKLISIFGSMAAGAISSQGHLFLSDGSDLVNNLKESASKAIIYDPNTPNGAKRILEGLKYVDQSSGRTCYKGLPALEIVVEIPGHGVDEADRWIHEVEKEQEMFVEEDISKDDIGMVFLTSGTTGLSKMVSHRHSSLVRALRERLDLRNETSFFNIMSLGWSAAYPLYYTSYGWTRIISDYSNGFPENLGDYIISILNRYKPGSGMLGPYFIKAVRGAMKAGRKLEHQFNVVIASGGPIRSRIIADIVGSITRKVLAVYGGTEFLIISSKEIDDPSDFQDMCTGVPIDCDARVVGENGKDLPKEKHGEILIRTAHIFKSYLGNPGKTKAAFTEDGWYRTGDIGYLDQEGQLFVLCRKADAINKNGFLHYPGWMENLILKHHAIENAVVIGIPDPVCFEEICLCYKLVPGSDVTVHDLRKYCKKLFVTDEKHAVTPLPDHYLMFEEFVTNSNGKVDRKKIREEVLRRLKSDN